MGQFGGGIAVVAFWIYVTKFNPEAFPFPEKILWLILIYAGFGQILLGLFWGAYTLSRSQYVLSNQRAFIQTSPFLFWTRTKPYPIGKQTVLDLEPGPPGTIWFYEERVRTEDGTSKKKIGFQRIDQAEKVYRLMRDIQTGDG